VGSKSHDYVIVGAGSAGCVLRPSLDAALDVLTEAQALRIVFDGGRATGVVMLRHGEVGQQHADTEHGVCSGGYQTKPGSRGKGTLRTAFQAVASTPDSLPASRSDADIDEYLSRYAGTGYHPKERS
jgi:hypothetical protein